MMAEIAFLLASLVLYMYYNFHRHRHHWSQRGVFEPPDSNSFPFGNTPVMSKPVMSQEMNSADFALQQYNMYREHKFYGTRAAFSGTPILCINDVEIIKCIMVKDFDHFVDRQASLDFFGGGKTETDIIWNKQLVSLKGEEWRKVRATFSPIFTSGKLKMMMGLVEGVSNKLCKEVEEHAEDQKPIDLKTLFGKFSIDAMARCVFGLDSGAFDKDKEESEFVRNAKNIFALSTMDGLKIMMAMIGPLKKLMVAMGVSIFKPKEIKFFHNVVMESLESRIRTKEKRNDLIDMMMEAMVEEGKEVDKMMISATAMSILMAGYDTTAQTMTYCAYELTRNPEIQKRVQQEIDEAFENEDKLDYATVQSLSYLDMVLHETLRLHPVFGMNNRGCVKDYTIPGTNVVIKKGEEVHIHMLGPQLDPEHFPDPLKFNPENFGKMNNTNNKNAFFGFGAGPRTCLGMRFALMEAKVGLADLLRRFDLVECEKTPKEVTRDPKSFIASSKEVLWVLPVKRNLLKKICSKIIFNKS